MGGEGEDYEKNNMPVLPVVDEGVPVRVIAIELHVGELQPFLSLRWRGLRAEAVAARRAA